MYTYYLEGGLRVPNVDIKFKALKLAWIPRLLRNLNASAESWRVIPDFHFKNFGGLNFFLRSNYDRTGLDQLGIPSFYKKFFYILWN